MPGFAKLDVFAQNDVDGRNKTNFGGMLTLLMPVAALVLVAYTVNQYKDDTYLITSTVETTIGEAFHIDLTCRAPGGCYFGAQYNTFGPSATCAATAGAISLWK